MLKKDRLQKDVITVLGMEDTKPRVITLYPTKINRGGKITRTRPLIWFSLIQNRNLQTVFLPFSNVEYVDMVLDKGFYNGSKNAVV